MGNRRYGIARCTRKKGFDEFFGFYHQIHAHNHYTDYLWRNSIKELQKPNADGKKPYAQYTIFDNAKKFIRKSVAEKKPFFCYCPWTPPHGQFVIPENDPAVALYKDQPWSNQIKTFAAMVSMIDRQLGELLDLLKELDVDDSTIVLFMSDNGGSGRHESTLNSCGQFRGAKGCLYEGGIRVPLIVKWNNKIKAGSQTDLPVAFYDYPATLLELLGEQPPKQGDGVSFAPTLLGRSEDQKKHEYLYWEYEPVNWSLPVPGRVTFPEQREQAVRMEKWKAYRKAPASPMELYDLSADVGEKNNIAAKYPDVTRRMEEIMKEARVDMRPQPEPAHPNGKLFN